MSNPATTLAELLAGWHVPAGQRPEDARGIQAAGNELEFWRDQARAIGLMLDIERALAALEISGHDVSSYQDALTQWYRTTFSYNVPWQAGASTPRQIIDAPYLNQLRGLGTTLNLAGSVPVLLPDVIEQIQVAVEEAEDLIKIAPDLDDATRRFMLGLVWELKRCLAEVDTFGSVHVRTIAFSLTGAMQSHALEMLPGEPEVAETWFRKARRVIAGFLTAGGVKAIEAGTTEVIQKMLEQ